MLDCVAVKIRPHIKSDHRRTRMVPWHIEAAAAASLQPKLVSRHISGRNVRASLPALLPIRRRADR